MKHEANLVFQIGMRLAFEGIDFELEWTSPYGRHDLAIKDDETLWGIIEVKHVETEGTLQLERYKRLDVPLKVVHWKTDLVRLIEEVKAWKKGKGVDIFTLSYRIIPGVEIATRERKRKGCPAWLKKID